MSGNNVPARNAEFLDALPLSETVRTALVRAIIGAVRSGEPLQTGRLLAMVVEADSQGDWSRVWPSYDGSADARLAAATDTRSAACGFSWLGVPLSQDLLSALRLLAAMSEKYEMHPVQPGAIVLALAANPGSGAARYLTELSATPHPELLDRIQADLLGTTLDGFGEFARRWAIEESFTPGPAAPRWQVLTRLAVAAYCAWVGWLALRAGLGGTIGTVFVVITILLAAAATVASRVAGASPSPGPRRWQIEFRPRYASPGYMVAFFLIGLTGVAAIYGRHRNPVLFVPTMVVLTCFLLIVVTAATFHFERQSPASEPAFPAIGLLADDFMYRTLLTIPLALAVVVAVAGWYAHTGLAALKPQAPARPGWDASILYWLRSEFTRPFLGSYFAHAYWPLLAAAAAAAGGYFCALAAQVPLTRARQNAWRWTAGSCATGLFIVGANYLPGFHSQAIVPGGHATAAVSASSYDEETVNRLHNRCQGFEPAAVGCPFAVAHTSDGQGGTLYAIALTATAGDSCAGSVVYFFDGETLITDTTQLPPGGTPSEAGITSPDTGKFMIKWRVNPSANVPCYKFGTGGADSYLYAWNGDTVVLVAGKPPRSPLTFPPGSAGSSPPVPGYLARLEYCGTISVSSDGSSGPLACDDGRPSWSADDYFRGRGLKIMTLGPNATVGAVEAAVCADARHVNVATASGALQLAAAEQGWPFAAVNFTTVCGTPEPGVTTGNPVARNGWISTQLPVSGEGAFPSISCPSPQRCVVASGDLYANADSQLTASDLQFPLLLMGSRSSWIVAQPTVLPGPSAGLSAVACPSPADCIAVGSVPLTNHSQPGLVVQYLGSSVKALTLPFPQGVNSSDASMLLSAIACAAPSACIAVGSYQAHPVTSHGTSTSPNRGVIIIGSGQRWKAVTMPLPSNAASDPKVSMTSVTCPSAAQCVAVGEYTDSSGNEQGMLVSGAGSSWTALQDPVPDGSGSGASLLSVICPFTHECLAVGSYGNGHGQGLIESGWGTHWTATESPLPANASVAPSAGLDSIACPVASSCIAVGFYDDNSGNGQGYLVTQSGSTWQATEAPLPANANQSSTGAALNAIACPTAAACVAAGYYDDLAGHMQGVVLSRSGSSWVAAETPVPVRANSDPKVDLYGLACPAVSMCSIIGEYTDSAGLTRDLAITRQASLPPQNVPARVISGEATSSLVASSLPAALRRTGAVWARRHRISTAPLIAVRACSVFLPRSAGSAAASCPADCFGDLQGFRPVAGPPTN
jgi:hypothetical protein